MTERKNKIKNRKTEVDMCLGNSRVSIIALCAAGIAMFLVCFAAVPAAAAETGDVIEMMDGTLFKNIIIIKEEYDKVRYKIIGQQRGQDAKSDEIREIQRNSYGSSFLAADTSRRAGRYEEAIRSYKNSRMQIPPSSKSKAEPVVTFWIAECYRQWGKYPEAKKEYDKFSKNRSWARHRYLPAIHYGLALISLSQKKYTAADSEFRKLSGGKFGTMWKLRGQLGSGIVQFRKGSHLAALGVFKTVERNAKNDQVTSIEQEAKMWQGKCLLKAKKYTEARDFFKKITDAKRASNKEVMASAWNGLGTAYYGLSRGGSNKNLVHKALMAHLRVALVYSGFRAERLEALRLAANAAGKLGLAKTAKELKREYDTAKENE
jgi:tetratricopeptide (TPR) repeat protein